jgi:hypothetical protein
MARRDLLPIFMQTPLWTDFCDTVDEIFGKEIDEPAKFLSLIRTLYLLNPQVETKIEDRKLFSQDELTIFDKTTTVRQANLVGFPVTQTNLFDIQSYARIARNMGSFWFNKGTKGFIDFIAYCLSADLQIQFLWTEDYQIFLPEGSPGIGLPVYDGGTWYPTSQVQIDFNLGSFGGVSILSMVKLFNEISNYNLVINNINAEGFLWIAPDNVPERPYPLVMEANIVALGGLNEVEISIANF